MSSWLIVGLGNPGKEYENTPHNAGRMVVEAWCLSYDFPTWQPANNGTILISKSKLAGKAAWFVLPQGLMNNSGRSLAPLIKSKKQLERLIIIHDDLDLPLGAFKVSFNRGSAGHRGVESIMKKLGSRTFFRLRLGISPVTPSGKLRKPASSREVVNYLLTPWKNKELLLFKKVFKKAALALELIVTAHGR